MKKFRNKKTGETYNVVTPSLISDYSINTDFVEIIKDNKKIETKEEKSKVKDEK